MSFDNSNQTARIRYRWRADRTIAVQAVRRGVSPVGLLASTRFPVERIRVCGGEPTLHPSFDRFARDLASHTKYLSVVTNGQWKKPEIAKTLVRSFDLIEVSVDAGGKSQYEHARVGASFERLEQNLELLQRRRAESGSRAVVNIRLMLRPSTASAEASETNRWARLSDCVMPQYIIDQRADGTSTDVFVPVHLQNRLIPRCTMRFKDLAVRSDGTVPVCHVNGTSLDPHQRIVLGNVLTDSLSDLRSSTAIATVRNAHRTRNESELEFCRGCAGR